MTRRIERVGCRTGIIALIILAGMGAYALVMWVGKAVGG